MERLVCLALLCVASALANDVINPRGARPVEHGTRNEKCASQKEWPFCTDDQWGSKCPSGCRIQGLMDKKDHGHWKTIEKIRSFLEQNKEKHRSANELSKQTYDYLKDKLTVDAGHDNSYFGLAGTLQQKITDMKIKIDRQLRILAALKDRIKDQVVEMQRLEVDIDIKLRSCKGSCAGYSEYQVDQESYVALDKQVSQLDNQTPQEATGRLYVMKSRPLQGVLVDSFYKSKDVAGQQREEIFPGVPAEKLELEVVGSPKHPATVSKDPGTPLTSSSSSSSTHTSSCTVRIETKIVHTKDGPVERTEEVVEGGPGCKTVSLDGLDDFFSVLGPPPSSPLFPSSPSETGNHFSGGAKGSQLGDSKKGFGDPFAVDFGGFGPGIGDDDVPDFQARGVKTVRVERQADYVGQDCVAANRNHLKGGLNGLFKIRPGGTGSTKVVEVYCQQEGLMGGWLLAQQRESGVVSFNRTWAEYSEGFGSVDAGGRGEVWLGNQYLYQLTSQGETMLKVELEDWEGGAVSAEYTIRMGSADEGYPLHVSGYSGDAGDALTASSPSHDGMKFSTFDNDNDKSEGNCAEAYGGGWWYNSCQAANLNGIYYEANKAAAADNGVVWSTYKSPRYSLRAVRMWIRSTAF